MSAAGLVTRALQTGVWVAVLLGLVLLIRRPFAKAFGAQAAYWLWALPALRTVLPPLPGLGIGWPQRPNPDLPIQAMPALPLDPSVAATPAQAAPGSPTDWALVGLIAYALVGAGWFAFTFARHLRFRRAVIRDSDPVSLPQAASAAKALGLRRLPELRLAHDATGPLTFGWLRPVVVLPAGATDSFTPAELSHILLHEFAHAKRGDLLAAYAALLFRAFHWANPLAHIAARSFRADMEAACDAHVLRASATDAPAYAATLIQSATQTSGRTP